MGSSGANSAVRCMLCLLQPSLRGDLITLRWWCICAADGSKSTDSRCDLLKAEKWCNANVYCAVLL